MLVPSKERGRHKTRKGTIVMNVLKVCSLDMEFIYVLPSWEGSIHDGHVLRNTIFMLDSLQVPQGNYN